MRYKSVDELPPAIRDQVRSELARSPTATGTVFRSGEYSGIVIPEYSPQTSVDHSKSRASESKRSNKFGAERVEAYGLTFASKWQAQRYGELLMLERTGQIRDLSVEVPFALDVAAAGVSRIRIGAYVADAVFWRGETLVVEDAKSVVTRKHPLYVWKKAHFEAQYGLRITEVERNKPRFGA